MLTNKDINFDDARQILTINGEAHAVGDPEIPGEIEELDERVTVLEAKKVKYSDVTLTRLSSGYAAPVTSAGGAVYERLGNYSAVGVARDKILSVNMINWGAITKSFSFYLGESGLTALSDATNSIYNENDPGAYIVVRVVYTD